MNAHRKAKKFEKTDKAYDFLLKREIEKKAFTIRELALCTGWKEKSAQTYISKKWRVFISKDIKNGLFWVDGLAQFSKIDFRQIHSQAIDYTEKSPEIKRLVHKSREFALIGVTNYNNPFLRLKTHSFIVNIIIAYTTLFHAIFEKNNIDYFYRDKNKNIKIIDGEYKSFELLECCRVYRQAMKSAVEANLKFLVGLRNKIEHRSLPALDLYVEGECQAAIVNYEDILIKEFGEQYSLGSSLAISMQLTKISNKNRIKALKELQTTNYKLVKNYIDKYRAELDDEISSSQEYRISVFLIPKLGNHAKSADMCIEFVKQECLTEEEMQEYEKGIVLIKNKKNPYKFKPGKVTKLVKNKLGSFNIWMHTQCWKCYKARPIGDDRQHKGEYCGWIEGFDNYLYTQSWIDFLITKLTDREELERVKRFK